MLSISSSGEMEGEVVGEGEKVEVGEFTGQELANLVTQVRVRGYLEVNCGMSLQCENVYVHIQSFLLLRWAMRFAT